MRIDLDQHRLRAGQLNRRDRGRGRVGHGGHTVTRPDARRAQSELQRIRAVRHTHREARAQPSGKLALKRLHLGTEDVAPAGQHALHRGVDLRRGRLVGRPRIGGRHRATRGHV